jgi:hypothetical protein
MPTKMYDLSPIHQAVPLYGLHIGGKPVVLDGEQISLGFDLALLFSERELAEQYAASFPSLHEAKVQVDTIAELVEHFQGRVEYYILDRPPA